MPSGNDKEFLIICYRCDYGRQLLEEFMSFNGDQTIVGLLRQLTKAREVKAREVSAIVKNRRRKDTPDNYAARGESSLNP